MERNASMKAKRHPRLNRTRARRAAILARARFGLHKKAPVANRAPVRKGGGGLLGAGFDPELLYVECGRCGAPVLWDEGRATQLLSQVGIDPLELDSSCMLVTDGCPACGSGTEYNVRIFRVTERSSIPLPPSYGHA